MKHLAPAFLIGTLFSSALLNAQLHPAFLPYTTCTFDDGLSTTNTAPLPSGVKGRSVDTLTGKADVAITRGERIFFAYPGTDTFANVKVEQLPAASFDQGKKDLISNFDHILAGGDDSERNMAYALHPHLNGFEVYGMDRKKLEGNTLGIYLLFDNRRQTATTIYFLNQDPTKRKFSSLADLAPLRDHFIATYTACIHAPYATPTHPKQVAAPPVKHRR